MKIVLIANCQKRGVVDALRAMTGLRNIFAVDLTTALHGVGEETRELVASADVVLTQPASEQFTFLETERLRQIKPVTTFPNLFFTGFQPDITYVGGQGRRVGGPMGDYHSVIILSCYLAGVSAREAALCFSRKVFEDIGYFDAYARSRAELARRDVENAIDVRGVFDRLEALPPFMYTVNHPKLPALATLADQIVGKLGLPRKRALEDVTPLLVDHLHVCAHWPIYPALAKRFGVEGSYIFRQPLHGGGYVLGLKEFITRSYQRYARVPKEALAPRGDGALYAKRFLASLGAAPPEAAAWLDAVEDEAAPARGGPMRLAKAS